MTQIHPLFSVNELRQPHYWRNHTCITHELTPTGTIVQNTLRGTSVQGVRFDFSNLNKYWQAEHGWTARIKVSNTASTGGQTVKPTFVENFFDSDAIQVIQNGTGKVTTFPMEQVFLEKPLLLNEDDYRKLCKTLNHNATLTVGSGTAIGPNSSDYYWVTIPDPFPKGGFPYVAFQEKDLSIILRLQNAIAEVASGVLQLDEVVLELNLYELTDAEINFCRHAFNGQSWSKLGFQANRAASPTTLALTGECIPQKFDNLDDVEAIALIHIVHASRDALADAYFNIPNIADYATVSVNKKGGAPLFSTTGPQFMKKLRYVEATRQFPGCSLFENKALIYTPIEEDMGTAIHRQLTKGEYKLSKDDNIVIENAGVSGSFLIDTVAIHHDTYTLVDGKLSVRHGLHH
jgi:hypothetical protein